MGAQNWITHHSPHSAERGISGICAHWPAWAYRIAGSGSSKVVALGVVLIALFISLKKGRFFWLPPSLSEEGAKIFMRDNRGRSDLSDKNRNAKSAAQRSVWHEDSRERRSAGRAGEWVAWRWLGKKKIGFLVVRFLR